MISKEKLKLAIIESATRDTSANPEHWSPNNPTLGHCAIVALIVQDFFGGELLRASLENTPFDYAGSHYWNRLPDGSQVDLTIDQFEGQSLDLTGEPRTREYVLSYQETLDRYLILIAAVLAALAKDSN